MNMIYTSKSNLFIPFNDQIKVRLIYLYICDDNSSLRFMQNANICHIFSSQLVSQLVSNFTSLNDNSCWSLRETVQTLKRKVLWLWSAKKSSFESQRIPSLIYIFLTSLLCFPIFPLLLFSELERGSGNLSRSKVNDLSSMTKFNLVLFKINSHNSPCSYVPEASGFLV